MRATYETWRRQGGLASWTFSVPALPDETVTELLRRCVARTMAGLDGFARVHDVDVATAEHGEDPQSIAGEALEVHGLNLVFSRPEHVTKVSLSLDPLVTLTPEGVDTPIERAALLEFQIDEHSAADRTVSLHLSIDIDIYSPVTWGQQRENYLLATLNAPRLAKFLQIVRRDLHAACDAIDAEGYPGLVDETGFQVA